MTAIVLARAVLVHTSGLPKDADINDFVFAGDPTSEPLTLAEAIDSAACVQGFYNFDALGGGIGVGSFLSASVSRTGNCHVDYYDITGHLDGSPHGSPITSADFDIIDPTGSETLPSEVSAVVTLFGTGRNVAPVRIPNPTPPPDFLRPMQSLTGRLYVGPLNSDACGVESGEVRLTTDLRNALAASSLHVMAQAAAVDATWRVWSRKNASTVEVVGGRIDNAPDTQRRRGVASSARTLFGSPG